MSKVTTLVARGSRGGSTLANYDATFTNTGVILRPTGTGAPSPVYIQARSISLTVPISEEIFEVPTRASKVVVSGKRHLHEGSIDGLLMERNEDGSQGSAVSPRTWAQRLFVLVNQQDEFPVALESDLFNATRVKILGGYSISPGVGISGYYDVSIGFIEVT